MVSLCSRVSEAYEVHFIVVGLIVLSTSTPLVLRSACTNNSIQSHLTTINHGLRLVCHLRPVLSRSLRETSLSRPHSSLLQSHYMRALPQPEQAI
jgi:hypothetical protein